jgi:pyruvate dehydrogenase E1 component alpha subunit
VSATEISERACSYGIETSVVNGQDLLETYLHFEDLVEKVRGGGGPRYVDIRTYRFKGHSMSDPVSGTYRSKEEVESRTQQDDPIGILKNQLMAAGALDQEGLEEMDRNARAAADDAADFAEASPLPEASSLYEHVYADPGEHGRIFLDGRGQGGARG